jgi:hypothetical protein
MNPIQDGIVKFIIYTKIQNWKTRMGGSYYKNGRGKDLKKGS